jgi:hypothetical protein
VPSGVFQFISKNGGKIVSTGMRILCLIGAIGVMISGVIRIVKNDEWTLAILGLLILGFTISGFFKDREDDNNSKSR